MRSCPRTRAARLAGGRLLSEEQERAIIEKHLRRAGLHAAFNSVFPIKSYSGHATLEYVYYYLGEPVFDVKECQMRGLTYAAPLRVRLRLRVMDKESPGASRVKRAIEQEVYLGELPLMTENGTFIVNGTERVIVSQLHRSPGVILRPRQGQDPQLGQAPVPGARDPVSRLLARLRIRRQGLRVRAHRPAPQAPGHDPAARARLLEFDILRMFFDHNTVHLTKKGLELELVPERLRGEIAMFEISAGGKVIVEEGRRITARHVRQLEEGRPPPARAGRVPRGQGPRPRRRRPADGRSARQRERRPDDGAGREVRQRERARDRHALHQRPRPRTVRVRHAAHRSRRRRASRR